MEDKKSNLKLSGTYKNCLVCKNLAVPKELLLQHIAEHYFFGGLL